jgi:hypothetical protein
MPYYKTRKEREDRCRKAGEQFLAYRAVWGYPSKNPGGRGKGAHRKRASEDQAGDGFALVEEQELPRIPASLFIEQNGGRLLKVS